MEKKKLLIFFSSVGAFGQIKENILNVLPHICEVLPFDVIKINIVKILSDITHVPSKEILKKCLNSLSEILKICKNKADIFIKDNINFKFNFNFEKQKISVKPFISLIENIIEEDKKIFLKYDPIKNNKRKYENLMFLEKIGEILSSIDKEREGIQMKIFNFYIESAENYIFNNSLSVEMTRQIENY